MTRNPMYRRTARAAAVVIALAASSILLVADSAGPQCKRGESTTLIFDASTTCGAPTVGTQLVPRVARIEIVATDRGTCELGCWDTAINTLSGEQIFANEVVLNSDCPADNGVATVNGFTLQIQGLLLDGVTPVNYDCNADVDGSPVGEVPNETTIICHGWLGSGVSATTEPCSLTLVSVQ
jgi:hypothetical protein